MRAGEPLTSVVVPAYNAEQVLGEAIRSVEAQGYGPLEIVVVDDGSRDRTAEVAGGFAGRVRYLRQANRGPSAARNAGLAATTGELVAFLDADDLWPEGSLRLRIDHLVRHPDCDIVQGLVRNIWPDPGDPGRHTLEPPRFGFNLGCALFRRSLLRAIGGFDESLRYGEDVDLLIRAEALGAKRRRLDEVTLLYRRRLSDDIDAYRRHIGNLARAVKRTLDQRRRGED